MAEFFPKDTTASMAVRSTEGAFAASRTRFQEGDVGAQRLSREREKLGWTSLLRQPHFAHQLSKPWVGTYGVE